ncbi:MAG: hypothetical protein KAJ35_09725, partial [Thermoplasmata archaeon]|nr:hypothetical protein [Thermoplasmata archaeon]
GIGLNVLGSISAVQASHELMISNVDILNTPDNGVEAMVIGYFGVGFDVHLTDVVIDKALFNGIKALTSSMFSSGTNTIDMDISLTNVDISTISGTGINLGSELIDYAGTRAINAHGLDIANTQKAMVLSGVKGGFWDTSITGSLKQDVVVITSEVELFRPILDILDPEKVQVIESGSVRFWFSLKVHVNWDTGLPVEGAVVEITDNHHTLIGAFTQFDDTGLPELTLNSYQFSEIGQFTRSPYVLNVTFRAINKLVPVELDFDTVVNIELADHVAPQVFINEPLSDHIQRSTIIDVRGSSFDTESAVDMVEVSIDGVNWIQPTTQTNWASWAHTFTVTEKDVDDNGGIFTIRARATDAAGNDATFLTSMEIDPFPPELRIDFPYDGLQTNTPAIDVRGVTERGATVRVNGVEVVLAGTLFLTQLDLVEGPNTITVAAADALGNAMEMKMEVVLDTKPPYLVLLTPEEGELFNEPTCTVSGQAEDDLRIWVNDNLLGDDHYGAGTFEYAVSLTRGENMVTLKSIDLAGNELHLSRIISLDDVLPILAVQAPLDGSHHNSMTIDVFGTTDEDSYLLINSDLVVLDHGLFAYSIVGVEGMNEILIVTSDEAGNVVSETLT